MKTISKAFTIVGILGLLYFGWAQHRMGPAGMLDKEWPRAWPYPDSWLNDLHDWFDARYPAAPDCLKLHGEIFRVRLTLWAIIGICSTIVLASIGPYLWRIIRTKR